MDDRDPTLLSEDKVMQMLWMQPFGRVLPALAVLTCLAAGVEQGAAQSPILLRLSNAASADRLVVDSAGGMVVRGTILQGSIPASGEGTRLMWYPGKAAFRAGHVLGGDWDDSAIGRYSVATGYNSRASGNTSTSMGLFTEALADYSIAMGYETTASGYASVAMGRENTASGNQSSAMGHATTASGENSTATGVSSRASGHSSTAMGWGTTASGESSTAMGRSTIASGLNSTAMGRGTTASRPSSTAMGDATTASGDHSTALGSGTTASGPYSTAMGYRASTNGFDGSFVYGDFSTTAYLNATQHNQVSFRAHGGYRLFTNEQMTIGAALHSNQTSWSTLSDRNRKTALLAVDGEEVLARIRGLPVSTWIYTDQPDETVRHIGPMAQDWDAAFPEFGGDGLTINSGDFDGVNLAAAQALERRTAEQEDRLGVLEEASAALRAADGRLADRVRALEAENAALRARLAGVEQMETRLRRLETLAGTLVESGTP
jgi:trimeric autotransporter adhesin